MTRRQLVILLSALAAAALQLHCAPADTHPFVVGVHHQQGCYSFTPGDYLSEGSDRVAELGARAIGVFMGPEYETYYPGVGGDVGSLAELAQTDAYRRLFDRFEVVSITCYAFAGGLDTRWRNGIESYDPFAEYRGLRALAEHLLRQYSGSGKVFILKNWEGDWMLRGGYDVEAEPTPAALRAMTAWLEARVAAVVDARAAVPSAENVGVYSAVEFNLVAQAQADRATVLTRIVPRLRADLYSYSAWDSLTQIETIGERLDLIASLAPDSVDFGDRNVFVGEFGCPDDVPLKLERVRMMLGAFRRWGVPYCFYWQIFDNECDARALHPAADAERAALRCRGYGLIDQNGRTTPEWEFFRQDVFTER